MPIYEFLCGECNRIFSFHSFKVATEKIPTCPKCGSTGLARVPSTFGVGTTKGDPASGDGADFDDLLADAGGRGRLLRVGGEGVEGDDGPGYGGCAVHHQSFSL